MTDNIIDLKSSNKEVDTGLQHWAILASFASILL